MNIAKRICMLTIIIFTFSLLVACANAGNSTDTYIVDKEAAVEACSSNDIVQDVSDGAASVDVIEIKHEHQFVYISNDDFTHTKKCSGCDMEESIEECVLEASDTTELYSQLKCNICGFMHTHDTDLLYSDNEDGTHSAICESCGMVIGTEEHMLVNDVNLEACESCGYINEFWHEDDIEEKTMYILCTSYRYEKPSTDSKVLEIGVQGNKVSIIASAQSISGDGEQFYRSKAGGYYRAANLGPSRDSKRVSNPEYWKANEGLPYGYTNVYFNTAPVGIDSKGVCAFCMGLFKTADERNYHQDNFLCAEGQQVKAEGERKKQEYENSKEYVCRVCGLNCLSENAGGGKQAYIQHTVSAHPGGVCYFTAYKHWGENAPIGYYMSTWGGEEWNYGVEVSYEEYMNHSDLWTYKSN